LIKENIVKIFPQQRHQGFSAYKIEGAGFDSRVHNKIIESKDIILEARI